MHGTERVGRQLEPGDTAHGLLHPTRGLLKRRIVARKNGLNGIACDRFTRLS
jgi:hypothetical protein